MGEGVGELCKAAVVKHETTTNTVREHVRGVLPEGLQFFPPLPSVLNFTLSARPGGGWKSCRLTGTHGTHRSANARSDSFLRRPSHSSTQARLPLLFVEGGMMGKDV